jgi:dTDP-4-amino-4,6-dideoxygalactose transaminase
MIREKIELIPRYNWDYRLFDLSKAIPAAFGDGQDLAGTFERIFGQRPILTTSGRASLYAILKSLNLTEGSYVGVPLFCCPVVFDAVEQAGLVPRFIDINLTDYNLSTSDLAKKKNSLTAIVVVHMFGHPADMDSISKVCSDVPIIEDCAQSLFSMHKGRYTGFESTASFYSFRSGKYISAGEGSAIFSGDPSLQSAIKDLVEHFEERSVFQEIAHCSATFAKSLFYRKPWYGLFGSPIGRILDKRLNLTAKNGFECRQISKGDSAIIGRKIKGFIKEVNKQRQNALALLRQIRIEEAILPIEKEGCISNYYQFAIRFRHRDQRDFVAEYLLRNGIDSAKYLDDVVNLATDQYGYSGDCPVAELASKTVLVIPHHYTLSNKDLNHIADTLNEAGSQAPKSQRKGD